MMRLAAYLLAAAALVGCGSENRFGDDPPVFPDGKPRPLQDTTRVDTIIQVPPPVVDVLWTIDNSCSMEDEQASLVANFPAFMTYFVDSGLEYHVGVISTDLDDSTQSGRLRELDGRRFIDEATPDPVGVFTSMAAVGTDGSGFEKGRGAVYTALELRRNTDNALFYRQEAALHTIIITDEDDDTPDFLISQEEFVSWYRGLKPQVTRRTFSSIVSPASTGPYNGGPYLELTEQIGGIPWNINSPDWGQVLDRLGVQASGLRREFFLSQRPVPHTIKVDVTQEIDGLTVTLRYVEAEYDADGVLIGGDWDYDQARNSIRFVDLIPEPLSRVVITYTVLSDSQNPEYLDVTEP